MDNLNVAIFRFFNGFAEVHSALDVIFAFASEGLGFSVGAASVVYIVWLNAKDKLTLLQSAQKVILFALPVLLALAFTELLKALITQPRPFLELDNVTVLTPHGDLDSFPSGHATVYAALAVSSLYICRTLTPWLVSVAVIISLARLVAGIHWPIDIVVGGLIGIVIAQMFYVARDSWRRRNRNKRLKNTEPHV